MAAMSFNQAWWTAASICSSLIHQNNQKFLLTGFYFQSKHFITNHSRCQWWQQYCCKLQNVPEWNRDQLLSRSWHFCHLSTYVNFLFLEKWGIHFFQRCLHPLYFSRSPPLTQSSIPFLLWHPVLSQFRLSPRSTIKFKIKGCEQSYFSGVKLLGVPLFSLGRDLYLYWVKTFVLVIITRTTLAIWFING